MRLEKKRDAEIAQRQGSAKRTVFQIIWFIITMALGYFLINYLANTNFLDVQSLGRQLSIPTSWGKTAPILILAFVFAVFSQFFVMIGFLVAYPEGRRRLGDPTAYSRNVDPTDNQYGEN